jgi:hypothetical protein
MRVSKTNYISVIFRKFVLHEIAIKTAAVITYYLFLIILL